VDHLLIGSKLIRTYFSRTRLRQKIFTAVSHAYTRDDKKNCKPLGKMCVAGGLNRHDADTQTDKQLKVPGGGGQSVGSECSGLREGQEVSKR
jgi:hypothetical protein